MSDWSKIPIIFRDNRITRSYIGGKLINDWRKMPPMNDCHECEELLVTSIGAICEGKKEGYGVSRTIEDGVLLTDIIEQNPEGILGKKYHQYNPNHLSVLARAGDTIVRLVLQCHPRQKDAKRYFGSISGKTEAWYIARTRLVTGEENCVYVGFTKNTTSTLWKELIEKQDIDKMINCLHKVHIKEGDVILIPAGTPHAVGPGCIFLEIHECSDVTIRVEKNINGVELSNNEMYNGLNIKEGLELFDYTTYTKDEIYQKCVMRERNHKNIDGSVIATAINSDNSDAFGMEIIYIKNRFKLPDFDGHRVLIPTDNDLILRCEAGKYELLQGYGCLLPSGLKDLVISTKDGNKGKAVLGLPRELHE